SFKNVKRRFNVFPQKGYTIVDDYAHHPMEIKKVLEAGRDITKGQIIAVFQPHLFSRTKQLYREFADALSAADCVILDKIYPAREAPMPGVSSNLISDCMKENGYSKVFCESSWDGIIERLKKNLKKGGLIFLMGAGNITEIRKEIERWIK
ncbi:MAG TPA: cyanophycin synthetase, partial [Candidatus Goldiibacteriota bacterium]|nr:cyanophycin synthetase [Candidatus Goldiibacteriota bacterium]